MKLENYLEEIKLELTGGVLELEIPDSTLTQVINKSFRELQRYITTPKMITVPFANCIDLTDFKSSSITNVYRTVGFVGDSNASSIGSIADPMYAQQWMVFSNGGTMYNLQNYVLNYLSWSTLLQMSNTVSTDMAWREDKQANKLYINCQYDKPTMITIEYIPVYTSVEEITDDYWIDILQRLAIAQTKIILGRIRTRHTLNNAQWSQDGETMLSEGTTVNF